MPKGSLVIRTAQMARGKNLPDALNITVKSGDKVFAPSWDLVRAYKDKEISEEEYTEHYLNMMRLSWRRDHARWIEVANLDSVTLLCYCKSGDFCHRTILADMLIKVAESLDIKATYEGEVI
jgi:uncharacterized protein YeaO (DUF488 family)